MSQHPVKGAIVHGLQQALHNASIDDYVILEYRDRIGGRVWNTDFGEDKEGNPYSLEFGANWVCLVLV